MAKPICTASASVSVLLTLKSELWQSHGRRAVAVQRVLLTLKSELWQSGAAWMILLVAVLLTLKSELWQSDVGRDEALDVCCSH